MEIIQNDEVHCHQDRGNTVDKKARRKLIIASILCLLFMSVEVVGGVLANSLAIKTDAAHLLTDFVAFMVSLLSVHMAARPRSQRMNFGWHRAEVIGAIISVQLIWGVTGFLVYCAVNRILYEDYKIDAEIMLITSSIGVLINIIMGCNLFQGESSDGSENINVKAAFIHVLGDLIQSIGVFCAALTIYFQPTYVILDPICTFLFSILVLCTTIKILKDTLGVLMEATPPDVDYMSVRDTVLQVPGIRHVHNLRIWSLSTEKTALSGHLAVEPGTNPQQTLDTVITTLRNKYRLTELTLQIEEFRPRMELCVQCQEPSK